MVSMPMTCDLVLINWPVNAIWTHLALFKVYFWCHIEGVIQKRRTKMPLSFSMECALYILLIHVINKLSFLIINNFTFNHCFITGKRKRNSGEVEYLVI